MSNSKNCHYNILDHWTTSTVVIIFGDNTVALHKVHPIRLDLDKELQGALDDGKS